MAYVPGYIPGFNWDLFISYPMEAESWTKQFEEDLRDGTDLTSAKGLKVYFAPRSWPQGGISDDMLEAARSSAVFVAVLTRDALPDDETRFLQKEMEAFRESGPLKGRFFPIPLYPIDGSRLSRAMPVDNSQAFWSTNLEFFFVEDGIPLRLAPGIEPDPGRYRRTVQKVAYQLRQRLDDIRTGASGAAGTKGPFAGRTVILARKELQSNVEKEWEYIRKLLVNDGATVIPSATSGSDPARFEAGLEAAISRADLFVQLFSALDNLDDAKTELKLVAARKSIRILQWRKKLSDPKKDSAILMALDEENKRFCEGESVQTGLLEDFKLVIRDELDKRNKLIREELERRDNPHQDIGSGGKPYLYITADTSDMRLARQLQAAARKRTVADVMTQDAARRRKDFEQGLMLASGVVFLHGSANRKFVDRWLSEFAKKTLSLKIHPKITALYLAPPEKTAEDEPLAPFELRTEGSQKEFTLQGIEKICAELCG
jgi:hypothetical protein